MPEDVFDLPLICPSCGRELTGTVESAEPDASSVGRGSARLNGSPIGAVMDDKRAVLRHFLAALAYRTQKALRNAPAAFGTFSVGDGVRTPARIVCHMTNVLGYARTFFTGGSYQARPLASLEAEIERFHDVLRDLSGHLKAGTPLVGTSLERLLQGPLSDAMTHAGQLAMLRRLAGSPVPPENFVLAAVDADWLGQEQAEPVSPDEIWPEAPEGWRPPQKVNS